MWSERKGPKNEEQTIYIPILLGRGGSWFLLHNNAPAHQSQFWSRNSWQWIYDNTGPTPILSWPGSSRFLPVPSSEISTEGTVLLWRWRHEDFDRAAEKAFQKLLPGMYPTPLQLLSEVYSCKRWLTILKEMWLKLLYCLLLLRNKMIPRTFWSYHLHA